MSERTFGGWMTGDGGVDKIAGEVDSRYGGVDENEAYGDWE